MKIKKINYFNMIEVLLALTVIAIGMTSIMGLFPVGLKASRGAVAENSSANVADQMVTYMRVMGESSETAYDYTFTDAATNLPDYTDASSPYGLNILTSGDTTTINLKGSSTNEDIQDMADDFLVAYKSGDVSTSSSTFPRVAPGWAIFKLAGASDLRRRVYFITQGPNCTEDGGNRNIDYSAMALVWKDTVQIKRLESDGTTWSDWPDPASYVYSGKINIELSWPLELPYSQRKKRYYQVVINKP